MSDNSIPDHVHSVVHFQANSMPKLTTDLLVVASSNGNHTYAWSNGSFQTDTKLASIGWMRNLLRLVTQPNVTYAVDTSLLLMLRLQLTKGTMSGSSEYQTGQTMINYM